jgi:CheY-like chemotaxis protein
MNRDMLSRRFERRGFTMAIAVMANRVKLARIEMPDLIFDGYEPADPDGWEATRQTQERRRTKSIPSSLLPRMRASDEERAARGRLRRL